MISTKHDLCLCTLLLHEFKFGYCMICILHEFKFGHNVSQTTANINRAWGDGSTSDCTVRSCFQKFHWRQQSLEDAKSREEHAVLTMNNCMQLLGKPTTKCQRNVSDTWCKLCNSFTPFRVLER